MRALNVSMKAEHDAIRQAALAVRVARNTDQKGWDRFMRQKPPRGVV